MSFVLFERVPYQSSTVYMYSSFFIESNNCNDGDTRLVDGRVEREGRLEVCVTGVWATVCASNFQRSSAYVACKQAGYEDSDGKKKVYC